jgi:hypothetical protein
MIVIPHTPTGLREETLAAVEASGLPFQTVELGDDEAYWRLWAEIWDTAVDVTVIEQDIVPTPDVFTGFAACPDPWCAHAYEYSIVGFYAGTGCVRFRGNLLAATRGLMDRVAPMSDDTHPPKHWCRLDAWMQHHLHMAGYQQHRHDPTVGHLDPSVSHDCFPSLVRN